jgi:hypothetical protein
MRSYLIDESEEGYGRVFIPRGSWQTDFKALIEKKRIAVVRLSTAMGWRGTDIEFLRDLKDLRGIEIYSKEVQDASVITSLHNLQMVGLECDLKVPIDFSGLSKLEIAKVTWKDGIKSLLKCSSLKYLNILNWPDENLKNLTSMSRLSKLLLTSRKLASLDGIGSLVALQWLDLHACRRLTKLENITHCQSIIHLEITSCKSVRDISPIGSLGLLRELHLDNNDKIESLMPIRGCNLLERLSFCGNTIILDGKISAIQGMPKLKTLRFAPRRTYDRTREEILNRLK